MDKPWLKYYDLGVQKHLEVPQVALQWFLQEAAKKYPERACTIYQGAAISNAEMDAITDQLASGLTSQGVRKGQRVGILLPNLPQFIAAYYAILKIGAVVVAINPLYKAREIEYQVNDAGIEYLIALEPFYEMVNSIRGRTSLNKVFLTQAEEAQAEGKDFLRAGVFNPHQKLSEGDAWLRDLLVESTKEVNLCNVEANDVAIYQYTGGTTGIPKGAIGLHRNLVANTVQFKAWLANTQEGQEMMLAAIPLFHVYGMVLAMSLGIALAAPMVLIDKPRDIPNLLKEIERYRPTIFPGVPSNYNAIIRDPEVQAGKYDLSSIKACISGSAPLLRETKEQFEALTGGKLVEGYGLSEAPTATHCNPVMGENRTGSIGLPLPDVDAQIVSLGEPGKVLPPGEIGELTVRGPQVMQGYHNRVEETNAALREGWLYTGDIARMDEDGYFYIVDRKKEMIKVGGWQVWPREVEEVLMAHPGVLEAGVGGVPHPIRGETVKAWVVIKPGAQVRAEELMEWCRVSLANFKVPTEVEFREELPKTTVGKVLRRELIREHVERK